METILSAINALIFFLLAATHIYWVMGGGSGMDATIPTDGNGRKLFRPGRGITLVVALGLLAFSICNLAFAGWLHIGIEPIYIRYGILLIAIPFLLRAIGRSEEHTSELQSLMRISYAVFCLKKKNATTSIQYKDIRSYSS